VVRAGGGELFHIGPDPDEAMTLELFRLLITTPSGADVGRLDVIRRTGGWTVSRAIDAANQEYVWWDQAGRSLALPILGTRLTLRQPFGEFDALEQEVLLATCVDIGVGLRPYVAAMG
jgi:hypothetical protein